MLRIGKCDKCDQEAIGFTDDGDALCEDCLFEYYEENQ